LILSCNANQRQSLSSQIAHHVTYLLVYLKPKGSAQSIARLEGTSTNRY
jgi:hypothetical protein